MRITFLIAVASVAILVLAAPRGRSEPPNKVAKFMRAKLEHSQQLLEALALEDFDGISKHSQKLSLLSQDANWQVLQTPEYLQLSTEFRRAADSITDAARNKNLDGAALSYMAVTMKCIECHKHVRNVRMARLGDKSPAFAGLQRAEHHP